MKSIYAFLLCAAPIWAWAQGASLQDKIDAAAKSPEKILRIEGEYVLDSPLKLGPAHSGLVIDGGAKAVVSGERKVSGWVKDGNLWKASVDASGVECLFVNGVRATIARTELAAYVYSAPDKAALFDGKPIKDVKSRAIVVRSEDILPLEGMSDAELKGVCFEIITNWYQQRYYVDGIQKNPDGKTSLAVFSNPEKVDFRYFDMNPRFWILNSKRLVDCAGEYFFDRGAKTLWYFPRAGEKPETARASYATLPGLLEIAGKSPQDFAENITIRGVSFKYCAHSPETLYRTGEQAAAKVAGGVRVENALNIKFEGCKFEEFNGYALEFRRWVWDSSVSDCEFSDLGAGGIKVGIPESRVERRLPQDMVGRIEIKNNIICKYGRYYRDGVGVLVFDCPSNEISDNTIFDGFYSGISLGWTWAPTATYAKNNKVLRNKIFYIGQALLSDMGGIYTLGDNRGSVVSGNDISEVRKHHYAGFGIYCDESSGRFIVEKNYIHDCDDGLNNHLDREMTMRNNVVENVSGDFVSMYYTRPTYREDLLIGSRFERNIMVSEKSEVRAIAKKTDIRKPFPVIDYNIYWDRQKPVHFSCWNIEKAAPYGLDFAKWQKSLGYDLHSFVADPQLKDGVPQNAELVKKIGFEVFSTKDAGVKGSMKPRLDEILKDYKFEPLKRESVVAPWRKDGKK